MPALDLAASPVAVAARGATNGHGNVAANTGGTGTEAGSPFAAVLSGQMNVAASADPNGAENQMLTPVDAGVALEPAADSLAALLPMLLGTRDPATGRTTGKAGADDETTTQAELALTLLASPVAAVVTGTGKDDALTTTGNPGIAAPVARGAEGAMEQRLAAASPAIVAAGETVAASPTRADAPTMPITHASASMAAAVLDKFQSESSGPAGQAGGDAQAQPTLPEQAMAPMHAAAAARHADTDSTYRIVPAFGSRQWESAVGNSLVFMTGQHQGSAELVLTPPQLGRIEISVTVTGDQATATFVSASPAVREALSNALPRLTEILADAGITLSQADVNAGSPEQSPGNGEGRDDARRAATTDFGGDGTAGAAVGGPWKMSGRGFVDVFA
jgi:flagellar hook-length control protein FliK